MLPETKTEGFFNALAFQPRAAPHGADAAGFPHDRVQDRLDRFGLARRDDPPVYARLDVLGQPAHARHDGRAAERHRFAACVRQALVVRQDE